MGWRSGHSTVVINNILYSWGGDQKNLPYVHDNEEKRKITSSIDLLHLTALKWERQSTAGTPPVGVRKYVCTNIGTNIFYFGGNCKIDECYHNNFYELNTHKNKWREIVNSAPENLPMKKIRSGILSYNINGEYNLLVLGGIGPVPVTIHPHSQYIPNPNIPNRCYTNEVHIMCVSSSPGIIYMTHIMYYIIIIFIFFRSLDSTCHNRYSTTTVF